MLLISRLFFFLKINSSIRLVLNYWRVFWITWTWELRWNLDLASILVWATLGGWDWNHINNYPSFLSNPKPRHQKRSPQILLIIVKTIRNIIFRRRLWKDLEYMEYTSVTSETATRCICALQSSSLNHPLRKEIEVLANLKTTQKKKINAVRSICWSQGPGLYSGCRK